MSFYPALKYKIFTPFYDWFIRLTMPEKEVKNRVLELAEISGKQTVLDFGCGTGTLASYALHQYPEIVMIGLEVDPKMIEIANSKNIADFNLFLFDGKIIPFPENHFDKVLSTWVFHHLSREEKIQALKEIRRVLKPEGIFVIADWGHPSNFSKRCLFFVLQTFDTFNQTLDNTNGKMPFLIKESGFNHLEEKGHRNTFFGTLRYWVCR
jgi:ubiquinone/menaquinone biosynthesis C-methylase UbiE